jgi:hypothetical protein
MKRAAKPQFFIAVTMPPRLGVASGPKLLLCLDGLRGEDVDLELFPN